MELLKSMGWRPGQGIGPHLTQREKLRTKKELENVGMKFKTNTKYEDNDFEINELLNNFKVSPYEYESIAIKPKTDIFGLGYESIKSSNVPIKSTEKVYSKLTVGGKSIHGQVYIIYINNFLYILLYTKSCKNCILKNFIYLLFIHKSYLVYASFVSFIKNITLFRPLVLVHMKRTMKIFIQQIICQTMIFLWMLKIKIQKKYLNIIQWILNVLMDL